MRQSISTTLAVLAILGPETSAEGQTLATVAVEQRLVSRDSSLPMATCAVSVNWIGTPLGFQRDSLVLRIIDSVQSGRLVGSPDTIQVFLGERNLLTLGTGYAGAFAADSAGRIAGNTLVLMIPERRIPLCAIGIPVAPRILARDSLPRRLRDEDSMQVDSVRLRKSDRGTSFVMLSLIKSIAGEIPDQEFFDIRLKFGDETKYFTMASVDVSLSTQSDTSRQKLTDAGLSLNYAWDIKNIFLRPGGRDSMSPNSTAESSMNPVPIRVGFVTGGFKIFNSRSYVGLGIGGLELRGSRLEGSIVTLSYMHQLYPDSFEVETASGPQFRRTTNFDNMLLEFFLRVPGIQFLDRLRVRGGILLPFDRRHKPETRIVLSVPIADLERF